MSLVLHNYFRSSASMRVRVALNLKGLTYDYVPYHLRKGEHRAADFLSLNPQGLVPALELEDGKILTQSLAIIEFLEELHPSPALLPKEPLERARVRAIALAVACDLHPVNNLRVLNRLRSRFGADDAATGAWFRYWVGETFGPLETMLAADPATGKFSHGDAPGLADLCLFAQAINNKRFAVDTTGYPTIERIVAACAAIPAFADAVPEKQPDAE